MQPLLKQEKKILIFWERYAEDPNTLTQFMNYSRSKSVSLPSSQVISIVKSNVLW